MTRLAFADLLLRDAAALVILKATAVLIVATVAAMAARGSSAARRHMIWLAALSSCAWLVVSSPIVPTIPIRAPMLAGSAFTPASRSTSAAFPRSGITATPNASLARESFPQIVAPRPTSPGSIPTPRHPLIAIWIIGGLVLLSRHAVALTRAIQLARRASVDDGDDTARELASVGATVSLKRGIALRYSAEVTSPITLGVTTPFVLLPPVAQSWTAARRRAVLLHEAAHVSRGDWLSQAIGGVACALLWFHPLIWRAFAQLCAEAERAADDCVLESGVPAPEYATHLLELARDLSSAGPRLAAVGIISTTQLERRFLAMFDMNRSRAGVTSRAQTVSTAFALALVFPFASLRVAAPAHVRPMAQPQAVALARELSARSAVPAATTIPLSLVRAPMVPKPTPEDAQRLPVIIDHSEASSPTPRPDFSGGWSTDAMAAADPGDDGSASDSITIAQTDRSITIERHGVRGITPIYFSAKDVPFDGSTSTGLIRKGNMLAFPVGNAIWEGDTLVLTTHVQAGGKDYHAIERMTLSADGTTMTSTVRNFTDGKDLWDRAKTFALRRIAP